MAGGNFFDAFKTRAKRKFYGRIPDENVLIDGYGSTTIGPDKGYFEIRVAEMFLSHKSEYGRNFVPFAVVASEFNYDGKRRTFPFFVDSELLKDVETYTKGNDINFRNTRVAGPVPYRGDDVGLFVGLYRVQVDDFARRLLGVLGEVVSTFDVTKLSNYVGVADVITDGLYSLFNFKELEYRTGDRDVFQDHGARRFGEGYWAYVNCDESSLRPEQLWVDTDGLKQGSARNALDPLRDKDFCLVQIQHLAKRNDYTNLPFHTIWREAEDRINRGDTGEGHALFLSCCREVSSSPDLTPTHAELLIEAYMAEFTKRVKLFDKLNKLKPAQTPTAYRSAGGGALTPQQSIQKTVQLAHGAGVEEEVLKGLMNVSRHWAEIPHLESVETVISDETLSDQITMLERLGPRRVADPKGLANALAIASLTAG